MKTVVLIRASTQPKVVEIAKEIENTLIQCRYTVIDYFGSYDYPFDTPLPDKDIDIAFAIGGDGTVLKAARICAQRNIPILPVKVGNFGFINDVQANEWKNELRIYLENASTISKLHLLKVCVADNTLYATNDISVCTAGYGTMRSSVYINEEFLSQYRSDGLLISTPIGSTAHSLSIGGPILVPGLQAMIFIPIAPFTLSNRPLVLSSSETIRIKLDQVQRTHSLLVVDGKVVLSVLPDCNITITNSEYVASIIQSSKRSYFEVLRKKLGWSGEFRA